MIIISNYIKTEKCTSLKLYHAITKNLSYKYNRLKIHPSIENNESNKDIKLDYIVIRLAVDNNYITNILELKEETIDHNLLFKPYLIDLVQVNSNIIKRYQVDFFRSIERLNSRSKFVDIEDIVEIFSKMPFSDLIILNKVEFKTFLKDNYLIEKWFLTKLKESSL